MKGSVKQTVNRSVSQSFKQLEPELEPEVDTQLLPATAVHYAETDRLAARIAANAVEQLDQLSLIGYATSFDEQTRDVVETSLRLAARRVLEA